MKSKYAVISLLFTVVMMGAILLQSLHTFHHLEKFVSEKHCHHKYDHHKAEIGHSHQDFDHCFVCELTFSNYTSVQFFAFDFKNPKVKATYSFAYSKEITQSFRGALFALRAPPTIIA